MTRPKGGRASPRYYSLREASEMRAIRSIRSTKKETRAEELIRRMATFVKMTEAAIAKVK